ncbi:MAG: endolytic transglycosylase MltG [Eubacteriales bacterium]
MRAGEIVASIFGTVFKIVFMMAVVIVVYKAAITAYDYGERIFAEEAISPDNGVTITVTITEGKSVKEIAEILEEKGLIRDALLFQIQELLSEYRGELQPGKYELSTDMVAEEMMAIMAQDAEETE